MATAVEVSTGKKTETRRKNELLDELRPLNPEEITERVRSWSKKEANKVLDSFSPTRLRSLLLLRIGIMKEWTHREAGEKADLEKTEKDLLEMKLAIEVEEGRYFTLFTFRQLVTKLNEMDTVTEEE